MSRILLIDDDANLLKMVKLMLERADHEVETSISGEEGLAFAAQAQPDLAIIDVMMPGLSGYDVVRKLREDPKTTRIPIIILTARSQPMDKHMALEAGANAFLSKPVTSQELTDRVDAVLRAGVNYRVHTGLLTEPVDHAKPATTPPEEPSVPSPAPREQTSPKPPELLRLAAQDPARTIDTTPGRLPILAVVSLRGGVGSTTVAVNLAFMLASRGRRVCMVDLSTSSGHIPLHMRLVAQQKHWGHLLISGDKPDPRALSQLLIQHAPSGITILAAPLVPAQHSLSQPAAQIILNELGGVFQHVVVDVPNLDPATIAALKMARSVIVVMSDDPPSVQTTGQFLVTLQNLGIDGGRVRVALNHTHSAADVSTETIQKALKRPLSAELPYDPAQLNTFRRGVPLALSAPEGPFSQAIQQLARTLIL